MLKTVVKTSVSRTAFAEMLSSDIFQMVYHPLPRARRSHTIGADVEKNSLKEEGFESDWRRWKRRDWRRNKAGKGEYQESEAKVETSRHLQRTSRLASRTFSAPLRT